MTSPTNESPQAKYEPAQPSFIRRVIRRTKRQIKRFVTAIGKRDKRFQTFYRAVLQDKRARNWETHVRSTPIDDKLVVFGCFRGRSYGCSPKAIYRAMLADSRFDDFTFVWAFRRPEDYLDHPDMARAGLVRQGSQEYYRTLAAARYWVLNSRLPMHVDPRPGQVYVQTWHGTPLKRIGCDLSDKTNALYSDDEILQQYSHDGADVTFFISPSPFASEKFITAFNLDGLGREGAILEVGYPRNDRLAHASPDEAARVRAQLDIPEGKHVVLYAPTWRDNQHVSGVGFVYDVAADFDRLRDNLGDDWVILFRAHYIVANEFDFSRYGEFVRDVSDVDDINDLYLASDMLVTDYSSVFFDYANLGKPVVFYMYDLEQYADEIRGFYLDLAELPGPVVRTQEELVGALRAAITANPAEDEVYQRFTARFTPLDDGHASERVLDAMLERGEATTS